MCGRCCCLGLEKRWFGLEWVIFITAIAPFAGTVSFFAKRILEMWQEVVVQFDMAIFALVWR